MGEYKILMPDGRTQNVKYKADDNGYTADVSYDVWSRQLIKTSNHN